MSFESDMKRYERQAFLTFVIGETILVSILIVYVLSAVLVCLK